MRFCNTLGLGPFLQPLSDPVPLLQVFARQVRDGHLALGGSPVRSRSSEAYLRVVRQMFDRLGMIDPRLNNFGNIDYRIQRWLKAGRRRIWPCNASSQSPSALSTTHIANASTKGRPSCHVSGWMVYVASFYLMRLGKHCDSGSAAHPSHWCDVTLRLGDLILNLLTAAAKALRANDQSSLMFTTQRSVIHGEMVGHSPRGALHACLCCALAEAIILLRGHNAPFDAPLASYCKLPSEPLLVLKSSDFTKDLRSAAQIHGTELGIDPAVITTSCFRTLGAMALFCGGVDSSRIRLLGRWQSWMMLHYLHLQAR